MYLLGIDLGTTGCKSIIFTASGDIVSEAYVEYPLIHTPEGFIEQDAEIWWELAKSVIREAVIKAGVNSQDIRALSVSSQGIAFVPVDRSGKTLCNAISWLDMRADRQTGYITGRFGESEIYRRTGKRISPAYSLPKIMWIKENKPEIYGQTWKFLMGLDFLTFRLTGRAVTDYSMASGTMAYNINEKQWDDEILTVCDIDRDKLPAVNCLGTRVGKVLRKVAEETGLSADTAVILGAQDQKCAAIGAGIGEGICTVSLGTAAAITTAADKPILDCSMMRIPCFPLDEGRWVLEAVATTAGACLKWIRNTFFKDKTYSQLDDIVRNVPEGSRGVFLYPHFEGAGSPYWKAEQKGFIYGMSLSTAEGDILRALYEGVAYQVRANIDTMEQLGCEINEIRVFGGGSKSSAWCRIIADITGKNVCVLYTSETANLGAAMIAGAGGGIRCNGTGKTWKPEMVVEIYEPETKAHELYNSLYRRYLDIQDKVFA